MYLFPHTHKHNRLPDGLGGRVFLFGDSSCADDAALDLVKGQGCLWLFKSAVRYACEVRFLGCCFFVVPAVCYDFSGYCTHEGLQLLGTPHIDFK